MASGSGLVTGVGWDALGYERVFDTSRQAAVPGSTLPRDDRASAVRLARHFEARAGYAVHEETDAVWMRDPGKTKAGAKPPFTVLGDLDAKTYRTSTLYSRIALIRATDYGSLDLPGGSPMDTTAQIEGFEASPGTASGFYKLSLAVAFHQTEGFEAHLRDRVAPAFFRAFPKGRIRLVGTAYDYERRQGCVRAGFVAAQYGVGAITNLDSLNAMSRWTTLAPGDQLRLVLDLGALALYPNVPYVPAYRPGLAVIFVPSEPVAQQHGAFPADWLDVYGSRADFANRSSVRGSTERVHRRHVHSASLSTTAALDWINWLIERAADHVRWSTDPTGYLEGGLIDFVTCFEHGLTADRLLRKGVAAQTAAQASLRKGAAFEVADILQELDAKWSGLPSDLFKTLFRPSAGAPLLKQAFASAPKAVGALLTSGVSDAYAALEGTVKASIIRHDKVQSAGVLVRNKALTAEVLEDFDTFTGNVVRALRNTHHGYMTSGDRQARPSRYLALVTGETPDELAYIGVLSALAYLADPSGMVQRPAYPMSLHP